MNSHRKPIRPYIPYSLGINNSYTYRDFLRRRPKKAQKFKFSIPHEQPPFTFFDEKKIQLKLLKALKLSKPPLKVDLKEFIITGWYFWKAGILSAWKRISHIKILSVTLMELEAKSIKRYFKYFSKLKLLNYQLNDPSTMYNTSPRYQIPQLEPPVNYLRYLKYSKRIRSLKVQDFNLDTNPFFQMNRQSQRYFRSLHHLALGSESHSFIEHSFPVEFCENLESISLQSLRSSSWLGLHRILNALPNLSHLKEIYLSNGVSQSFDIARAFREIAQRGILEKISLDLCCFGMPNFYGILEPLKLCKLKHLALLTSKQFGLLTFIAGFLRHLSDSLESFEFSTILDENDSDFIEICKQINKLQELKNLKLNISHYGDSPNSPKTQCFIPYLSDIFKKAIKMETFDLKSDKLPAAESFQNLTSALGTSTPFLTHLKIDIGTLPNFKKTYRSIISLLKNLSRIQVLEIPGLGISRSTIQTLIELAKTLHGCIYLRVFKMGEIKQKEVLQDFFKALEIILSKMA